MKKNFWILWLFSCLVMPAWASTGEEPTGGNITHQMMMLMFQLGIIIFAAKFVGILFKRFNMPGVLGELCAGMVIGPYLLGHLALPGFPDGIFPADAHFPITMELYGICSLAAIILLFLVGLESDIKLFMRFSLAGTMVGLGGVIFSFVFGDVTMLLLDDLVFGKNYGFFDPPCLFLGVISTATSVGITARILSEKKKLSTPEGTTILAGAVVDDVLGIITLAIVLGAISASKATGEINWAHIGIIAAKAIGIWVVSTVLGLVFARRISALLKWFKDQVSISIMALGLALILAGLFEEAGLAMIIGAYVAGLSLSQTDISRVIREKLEPLQELLIPIFFCSMGMMVNFQAFTSAKIVLFGLIYSVFAVLAKILGCSLPALFFGFNGRGAMRIGVGMIPRGEVALIVAGIGLATGSVGQPEFAVAILMTLLTTLIAPVMLVAMFNNPAPGTKHEIPASEHSHFVFTFPSAEITEIIFGKLVDAFEKDGFYVHSLDSASHNHYQLRQDYMVLELERQGVHIHFNCEREDEHIINSAVVEVTADLSSMLYGLNKPIDQDTFRKKMTESSKMESKHALNLGEYILPDCIEARLRATNKEGVLDELLSLLQARGHIRDKAPLMQALLEREKLMPTGLQDGLAMPHIKTDLVDRIICAVGIKREGLDFGALDGRPSRIFILELAPLQVTGPHLQFVSTVSQITQRLGGQLLAKDLDASQIHQLLTQSKNHSENGMA